jgi:hypothetical protein
LWENMAPTRLQYSIELFAISTSTIRMEATMFLWNPGIHLQITYCHETLPQSEWLLVTSAITMEATMFLWKPGIHLQATCCHNTSITIWMITGVRIWQTKETNSVALSPWANYTDWATATCRRNFSANFCG